MPEKFEPIKLVEGRKDIKEFQLDFSEQSLGELGKENTRLKTYLDDQRGVVQKHLDAFKKSALKEYTGILKWDNEKAVNQAMQDYAVAMNQILGESTQDVMEIAKKYGDLLGDRMTNESIDEHYKSVAEEFGPKLEARMLNWANTGVADLISGAEKRAKLPPGQAQPSLTPQQRQLRELGIDESYETHRTIGKKGATKGDILAGPQDIK